MDQYKTTTSLGKRDRPNPDIESPSEVVREWNKKPKPHPNEREQRCRRIVTLKVTPSRLATILRTDANTTASSATVNHKMPAGSFEVMKKLAKKLEQEAAEAIEKATQALKERDELKVAKDAILKSKKAIKEAKEAKVNAEEEMKQLLKELREAGVNP